MHTSQEPDPTSNGMLIFIICMIAGTMGLTVLVGPMLDNRRAEEPITNGERWERMCAVEHERGSAQDRKDCVTAHALQFAADKYERDYQQRLKAASSPYR
ncbi:hypothetical protein [Bradyrhizobium sp. LB11.1]|uniref:hypothetical protein n=1 Tax=Bradyrhizobium sp. LB11.1 TaxID=3156326 RepID=UPI003395BB27